MKVAPTLQGGLRIDVENAIDWMVLRCIPYDARGGDFDLASRVTSPMAADSAIDDWREFVVPDLKDGFDAQIGVVVDALADAGKEDEPAELFVLRDDAEAWYGALNQARLALEDRYGFIDREPEDMTPGERSAWFRSQFYLHVQSVLLDHVMR